MLAFFFSLSRCDDCYIIINKTNKCPICISRTGDICGYCANINQCANGDKNGPTKKDCEKDMWIYPKDTCTNDMCLVYKEQWLCRKPCEWNKRRLLCVLPRNFNKYTDDEDMIFSDASLTMSLIISFLILIVAAAIGMYVYSFWFSKGYPYDHISKEDKSITPLDALPKAHNKLLYE